SREEYADMMRIERELMQGIASALAANDAPDSAAAHAIVALHKRWLCFHWATYTPAAHRGLAALYLLDERFTAYYEKAAPGGAQFLHDAICAVLG
ncbi:MAG: TipAS antibiotic-recognition domain-containing protein, partial [Pygmaiobacter sp.]